MVIEIKEIKVEGLKELEKVMIRDLPVLLAHKAVARTLKKASKPMMDKAVAIVEQESGALALSIKQWTESKSASLKQGHFATVHIGPRRSDAAALVKYYTYYDKTITALGLKRGIYHGHLVEFGRDGKSPVAPRPFLEPAWRAEGANTIRRVGEILGKEIEKECKRLAKVRQKAAI